MRGYLDLFQKKRSPTRGIGLLYFILMDIYLVLLDEIFYSGEYELQFNEELERLKPDPGDSHELLLNKASRFIFESRFPRLFCYSGKSLPIRDGKVVK